MFGDSNNDRMRELTGRVSALEQELKFLRQRCDKYNRMLEAVWEILKERQAWSDADLDEFVKRVAKAAQAGAKQARRCPGCGRPLQENLAACMYCGRTEGEKSAS
jgi:DNA repair exonuclease SbcCD ATPase subunit